MRYLTRDELVIWKQTVFLEAEGESYMGKLAVAYTILNRAKKRNQSIYKVCWDKWQFSCWNEDERDRRIKRLESAGYDILSECEQAVDDARGLLVADPSNGATHYLNIVLTKHLNGGTLPSWVSTMKHTAKIGQHDFYQEA